LRPTQTLSGKIKLSLRVSIRSCSRWGLPCLFCYQKSGELLPHHFTLT